MDEKVMASFRQMAYESFRDIIFGRSLKPLHYGFDLKVGDGLVVPEVKYWPRIEAEKDVLHLKREFEAITDDLLKRAVELGVESLQLESELSYVVTKCSKLVEDIVSAQKKIMEKYHDKYGINLGLRVTPADIRFGLRAQDFEEAHNIVLEAAETAVDAGADIISIESMGGKSVFDHAIIYNDVKGMIFALGVLSAYDMKQLWKDLVRIAKKHGSIPGGDTACAFANTAMKLAGGLIKKGIPHTTAAMVRAASASRSLIAYEEGCVGPGKDCGYENVILKAITGYPMSMEGKSCASAHSSLVGNIAVASCDLWSNEQVENIKLFGGTAPQVFLEVLHYDVELMNTSLRMHSEEVLRDLLVYSDKFRDPQGFVLSPVVAWEVGKAIIENVRDPYRRCVEASIKALELIGENAAKLRLNSSEMAFQGSMLSELRELPEDRDEFIDENLAKYKRKVKDFNPSIYGF